MDGIFILKVRRIFSKVPDHTTHLRMTLDLPEEESFQTTETESRNLLLKHHEKSSLWNKHFRLRQKQN